MSERESQQRGEQEERRFSGYLVVLVLAALIALAGLIIWLGVPSKS